MDTENSKKVKTIDYMNTIRDVAKKSGCTQYDVENVLKALEDSIYMAVGSVDESTDVRMKILRGIFINFSYQPEQKKINNLTNTEITVGDKIVSKIKTTENLKENINMHWHEVNK